MWECLFLGRRRRKKKTEIMHLVKEQWKFSWLTLENFENLTKMDFYVEKQENIYLM